MKNYVFSFSGKEIEQKLEGYDQLKTSLDSALIQVALLQNNQENLTESLNILDNQLIAIKQQLEKINVILPDHTQYFNIDNQGIISLKPEFRGLGIEKYPYSISDNGEGMRGSLNYLLPKHIYIPEAIDNIRVIGLHDGIFAHNLIITSITLNNSIQIIPNGFCAKAFYCNSLYNTENIQSIGTDCFFCTAITSLAFPVLKSAAIKSLRGACYLQKVDIGNFITDLPEMMFGACLSLANVLHGDSVKNIGPKCFYLTRNLKTLDFLNNDISLGTQAFFGSRIQFEWDFAKREKEEVTNSEGNVITYYKQNGGIFSTPTVDNDEQYWLDDNGQQYTVLPYQTPLVTKLSQLQQNWENSPIGNTGTTFGPSGCAYFSTMHIHSALSNIYYSDPRDYIEDLQKNDATKPYVNDLASADDTHWLGYFHNIEPFFQALGYETEVMTGTLTTQQYQKMCNALSGGAMVYTTATTADNQMKYGISKGGHAVVLYGITENGEVRVLDSATYMDAYHKYGLDKEDFYTYTMPYQNLTGPNPSFVIVYPRHEKYFSVDTNGLAKIKEGSADLLPERIYVPSKINNIPVTGLQESAFADIYTIRTVTLNSNINRLPKFAFKSACNLQAIYNTENIAHAGMGCCAYTSVKSLTLPNLLAMDTSAFAYATYLQQINLGNYIDTISNYAFLNCYALTTVKGDANIKTIGYRSFVATRSLKTLPFLTNDIPLGDQAFFNSRIQFDWDPNQKETHDETGAPLKYPRQNGGQCSTPTIDNTIDYWSNASITPNQVPLVTILNQDNPKWAEKELGQTNSLYKQGCSYFAIMHIHSALSGKRYDDPREFIDELSKNPKTAIYVNSPEQRLHFFDNVDNCFQAMGYTINILSDYANNEQFNEEKYQIMCDALKDGAMVYTTCSRADYQMPPDNSPSISNYGHAVAIYGITSEGEVCVVDSLAEPIEYQNMKIKNDNICTYTMPYQNFTGPIPGCIIVYPKNK